MTRFVGGDGRLYTPVARYTVLKELVAWVEHRSNAVDLTDEEYLQKIRAYVLERVLSNARSPALSTTASANALEEYMLAEWASLINGVFAIL